MFLTGLPVTDGGGPSGVKRNCDSFTSGGRIVRPHMSIESSTRILILSVSSMASDMLAAMNAAVWWTFRYAV